LTNALYLVAAVLGQWQHSGIAMVFLMHLLGQRSSGQWRGLPNMWRLVIPMLKHLVGDLHAGDRTREDPEGDMTDRAAADQSL
jgi:hypothetical protein